MANIAQDLSTTSYRWSGTLFGSTTAITTNTQYQGVSVDVGLDVGNMITAVQVTGIVTGTTPTANGKMQESTDGTTWTDAVYSTGGATVAFAQVTTSNNVQVLSYYGTKRYQRSTGTVSGTNPVFTTQILVVGPRRVAPAGDGGFSNQAAGV